MIRIKTLINAKLTTAIKRSQRGKHKDQRAKHLEYEQKFNSQ